MNDRLTESVAYLRGLAEGMEINAESKEGKLIGAIIDIMGQFAKVIHGIEVAHDELNEYVESLDDDLSELESEILSAKEDDNDDDDNDMQDDDDDFDANEYLSTIGFGKGLFEKNNDEAASVRKFYDIGEDADDNHDEEDDDDE